MGATARGMEARSGSSGHSRKQSVKCLLLVSTASHMLSADNTPVEEKNVLSLCHEIYPWFYDSKSKQ